MVLRSAIPLCSPVDLLWGLPPNTNTNANTTATTTNTAGAAAANNAEEAEAAGSIIADDEEDGPTCSWEVDPTTGEIRLQEGRDADRNIHIATSYTNIEDLRPYVVSNTSFNSSGGCALFLETILRIHGWGAVVRMVRSARRKANLPAQTEKSLIECTCVERHKYLVHTPNGGWRCCAL
jgi:hypothetical protein